MATYSYEQFQKAAQDSGLLGTFSTSDLELARRNPDAGMSILRYKQDYNAATTDEARALANLGAESVRSSYGNYTGGADGSGFYLEPLSPSSFHAGTAPTYQNPYAGTYRIFGRDKTALTAMNTQGARRRFTITAMTRPYSPSSETF